jgi:hypothetical protein
MNDRQYITCDHSSDIKNIIYVICRLLLLIRVYLIVFIFRFFTFLYKNIDCLHAGNEKKTGGESDE